jgi:hypothetical protein
MKRFEERDVYQHCKKCGAAGPHDVQLALHWKEEAEADQKPEEVLRLSCQRCDAEVKTTGHKDWCASPFRTVLPADKRLDELWAAYRILSRDLGELQEAVLALQQRWIKPEKRDVSSEEACRMIFGVPPGEKPVSETQAKSEVDQKFWAGNQWAYGIGGESPQAKDLLAALANRHNCLDGEETGTGAMMAIREADKRVEGALEGDLAATGGIKGERR